MFGDQSKAFELVFALAQGIGGDFWCTSGFGVFRAVLFEELFGWALDAIVEAAFGVHQVEVGLVFACEGAFVVVDGCGVGKLVAVGKFVDEGFDQGCSVLHAEFFGQGDGQYRGGSSSGNFVFV